MRGCGQGTVGESCVPVCVCIGERERKRDQCGPLCLEVNLGEHTQQHIHVHTCTSNYNHLEKISRLQIQNDVENTLHHTHHNKLQSLFFSFHQIIRLKDILSHMKHPNSRMQCDISLAQGALTPHIAPIQVTNNSHFLISVI